MVYDLIILGAGPAGMTASIYASRYKINHLIFGDRVGGQFVDAHIIGNYPGFTSIDGMTLATNFRRHVESYGVKIREEKVGRLSRLGEALVEGFEVITETGEKFLAKSLLLAMGARHRALNVPGEEHYLGRGVSYCSACDAPLFRNKVVAVIGGGNSAITAAIHLSDYASKVYLIHRRDVFDKADPVWLETLDKKEKIVKIMNTQVKEIFGQAGPNQLPENQIHKESRTKSQELRDNVRGLVLSPLWEGQPTLPVEGVFIEIGLLPALSLANQLGVSCEDTGYIKTAGDLSTNVPGVFAAGDLVRQSDVPQFRQIITSSAQGAISVFSTYAFLRKKSPGPDWG